jgi:hypothetical protein
VTEYPDPPERTGDDDAPSGLPGEEEQDTPLGVPAEADPDEDAHGPDAMPGIPTDGDPPAAS